MAEWEGKDVYCDRHGWKLAMDNEGVVRHLMTGTLCDLVPVRRDGVPAHNVGEMSDGHHTFNELYDHRRALTAALLALVENRTDLHTWRSRQHHPDDAPCYEGYFIVGVTLPRSGTITYHYADEHWDDFAAVPELEHAPKWDGATPADSVTRLLAYARG